MIGTIITVPLAYLPVKPVPIAISSVSLDLISQQSANSVWIITDFSDTTPGHFLVFNSSGEIDRATAASLPVVKDLADVS